jgi:hypothetical protein
LTRDVSHLPGDLKRRVDHIETAIDRSARESVRLAAQTAKMIQLEVMKGDAGGDLRLSRVRSGKGAAIGARYDLSGTGRQSSAEVKATGPVPLLANPSKAHQIPRRNARRRKVLNIPGIGVRASANHRGTKGKDTWNRGRERAEPKVRTVIGKNTDQAVKRAFLSGG